MAPVTLNVRPHTSTHGSMSLTIYGTSRSRAFRSLWAAKEIGLTFEHKPLSWNTCATDSDYLSINPAGTIPCIEEDGFILAESIAINLHLSQRHRVLWPSAQADQSLALQWSFWAVASLEEPYTRWAAHTAFLPAHLRQRVEVESAAKDLARPMSRLEQALRGKTWLLQDSFKIADLNVASIVPLLRNYEPSRWPAANAWLVRCTSRRAFAQASALP